MIRRPLCLSASVADTSVSRGGVRVVVADLPLRERIQGETFLIWHEGLARPAYGKWNEAQMRTAWGRHRLHRLALVDDDGRWTASIKRYRFDARYDDRRIAMLGIGAVFTPPGLRGHDAAAELIERAIEEERAAGTPLAALFSEIGVAYYARLRFEPVPLEEVTLEVTSKGGSPAMLVRSGSDADLPQLAAMHAARSSSSRFALVRTPELIQYSISKRRLLAGLGPPGRRQTDFFVAEEGNRAAAYVVITSEERGWFIEEAGDRDPAAARLGAMLQVLIAREPSHPVPRIRAWWPAAFPVPPQVSIVARAPAPDIFMVRPLADGLMPLRPDDVFYWRSDYF